MPQALVIRARPPWQHLRIPLLFGIAIAIGFSVSFPWLAPVAAVLVVAAAYVFFARTTVEVGDVGVSFTRRRRRELVRFDELLGVDLRTAIQEQGNAPTYATHATVHFAIAGGRHIEIDTDVRQSRERVAVHPEATQLVMAVRARMRPREPHRLEPTLARGRRTTNVWLAALREIAADDAGYRESVADDSELLGIVEDARANVTVRAGAAFLMRRVASHRARVLAAAERATPELRAALLAIADSRGEEQIAGAFAALRDT